MVQKLDITLSRYTVLVDGGAGAYGVIVPDLPGCTAMGKTVDEALRHAADSMRDWAETRAESAKKVPKPRALDTIVKDAEVRSALAEGAMLASVPLIRQTGQPVKANLSIDAGTLEAIDAAAKRKGLTRSAFIEAVAKEVLPQID